MQQSLDIDLLSNWRMDGLQQQKKKHQHIPHLTAHRGYLDKYPENTWLGLKAAIDVGACWLEFDIQMCADGNFILMHDSDLNRTSDTSGSIFEMSMAELENISIHEPDRFNARFYPLPVTTLDAALEHLSKHPHIRFMVEIKEESLEHWGLSRVMDQLMEKLMPYSGNAVLISFSYAAIEYAKDRSGLRLGLVLNSYDQDTKEAALVLRPDYLICNHKKLPHNQPAWPGPWEWMLYEINSPDQALEWAALGVSIIETGDIGSMLQDQRLATQTCKHGV